MNRLFSAIGIDGAQWRALTRAYLLMDLRKSAGIGRNPHGRRRSLASVPYAGLVITSLLNSIVISFLVFILDDVMTAAIVMVAMTAMNSSMLLLIDFTGFVVSTHDYWIVAPRPVASRTYFAARIAAVLVYVAGAALAMSLVPSIVLTWSKGLGVLAVAGGMIAALLCCAAAAGCVISAYTFLVSFVHPKRLARALSSLQLVSSAVSLTGFYVIVRAIGGAAVRDVAVKELAWIWYVPVTWFAALVPALAGLGGMREWVAVMAALALTLVALAVAAGRLSLEFAERLAAAGTTPERQRTGLLARLPGFREGEAYAIATLVRAQFRYDMRFRFAILSIVPVTIFYIFLGLEDGALQDPFSGRGGATPVYLAITFLPMTLHSTMRYSEHWRASWVFFASPADPARLLIAAKNFVAIFFLGGYLLLMAGVWAWFYETPWHAVVHVGVIGSLAHMLLQWVVIMNPALPFAAEPRTAEQSSRVMLSFFTASLGASVGPLLLPYVYRRAWTTIALLVFLAAATFALERQLRRRAREEMLNLEYG
ncbi:MAG: hypothetical protein ABIS06_11760 [Vicinamibacterales bacterium]